MVLFLNVNPFSGCENLDGMISDYAEKDKKTSKMNKKSVDVHEMLNFSNFLLTTKSVKSCNFAAEKLI